MEEDQGAADLNWKRRSSWVLRGVDRDLDKHIADGPGTGGRSAAREDGAKKWKGKWKIWGL